MIKKWMNPELKELDVRRTKVIEPTIWMALSLLFKE